MSERFLQIKIQKPKMVTTVSFIVLVVMFVFGVITIKNVNYEYKIRSIAGNFQQYKYAALSFSNIYSGMPGDIINADFYWKDITRNGSGDGKIDHESGEGIAAWQQMQLAKLLDFPKTMTGKWDDALGEGVLVPGVNVPGIDGDKAGYFAAYSTDLESNVFGMGESNDGKAGLLDKPTLTPDDAYNLDLMMDDGYPDKGNLLSVPNAESDCAAVGEYKKEDERKECVLLFKF